MSKESQSKSRKLISQQEKKGTDHSVRGNPYKSMTYDNMQKMLMAKEEQIKQKDKKILLLESNLKQIEEAGNKTYQDLEKKVRKLETIIEMLEKSQNKSNEAKRRTSKQSKQPDLRGRKSRDQEKSQKMLTSRKKVGDLPNYFQSDQVCVLSERSERDPQHTDQILTQSANFPEGTLAIGGNRGFPRQNTPQFQEKNHKLQQKQNQKKERISSVRFNEYGADSGQLMSSYRRVDEEEELKKQQKQKIENKFNRVRNSMNESRNSKRTRENSTLQNIIEENMKKKDHQSALKTINEKLETLLSKSTKKNPHKNLTLSVSFDSGEDVDVREHSKVSSLSNGKSSINICSSSNYDFDKIYSKTPKAGESRYMEQKGDRLSRFSTLTAYEESPTYKINKFSMSQVGFLKGQKQRGNNMMSWKKQKSFSRVTDARPNEIKKQKILTECNDLQELLRIRKFYADEDIHFGKQKSQSYLLPGSGSHLQGRTIGQDSFHKSLSGSRFHQKSSRTTSELLGKIL